jgi:hypothetical protein
MRIKSISGTHLMGATFEWLPAALNFVFGRNDQGKTRLAVAIKVALLGYLPGLDKTPRGIFKPLASDNWMDVCARFDGGEEIYRSWSLAGETVKQKHNVPRTLDGATPLVMLDAAPYFAQSARGRVEMVFAVARLGDRSFKLLAEELARRAADVKVASHGGTTVQTARSDAAADHRRHVATLQTFAEMQLADRPASRGTVDIDKEIGTVQSERALKLARDIAMTAEETRWSEEIEPRVIELKASIRDAGEPDDDAGDFDQLRRDQDRLRAELADARAKQKALDDWTEAEDDRVANLSALEEDIADEEREVKRIPGIERKIKTLAGKAAKKCRTCKQPIVNAADAEALAAHRENLAELENIRTRLADHKKDRAKLATKAKAPPAPAKSPAVLEAELTAVDEAIARVTALGQVTVWRQELQALGEKPDHAAEREQVKKDVAALDDRETALKDERRRAESDAHDRKRMAEAETARDSSALRETALKGAKTWLLEKKGELIADVFGPLLDLAERFTRGIFPQKLEYVDGEIGYRAGDAWVTETTFGGARKAITHAALQAALGVNSPCRIVVMDELWRVDSVNVRPLLHNVAEAHEAGLIDQFVGIQPERIQGVKGFTFYEALGDHYEERT